MRSEQPHSRAAVWWLSPTTVTVVFVAVSVSLTAAIGDDRFRELWQSPKSVTGAALVLMLCGALALALSSSAVGAVRRVEQPESRWPALPQPALSLLSKASTILVVLTAIGYLSFAVLIVRSGVGWATIGATGDDADSLPLKDVVGTVPGLTTMTQFGLAVVIISSVILAQQYSRAELIKVAFVVGMGVPRAFLWSERLAILELSVAILVVACYGLAATEKAVRSIRLLPVVALPAVFGAFAAFEYFRSWNFYRDTSDSFWRFSAERAAGYYATALNNGYLELTHHDWPGHVPTKTVNFFWEAPGVQQLGLYDRFGGSAPGGGGPLTEDDYVVLLQHFGNPEFNNSTGYTAPFLDYGLAGGILYFVVAGAIAGLLYRSFREGKPFGILLYPLLFVGLVELPRYIHWAEGRSFPSWIALIVVALLLSRVTNRVPGAELEHRSGSTAPSVAS